MPSLFLPSHPENQAAMAAYMRDKFDFLGVKATERRILTRPVIQASKKLDLVELQSWLTFYYGQPVREYQYVAIDLAQANVKRLSPELAAWCRDQISVKAWWDSVDAWRKVMTLYLVHQDTLTTQGTEFIMTDKMWLQRVGITLQLSLKDQTNQTFLATAIEAQQDNPEFFIQKAIGWALRDYSKTAPGWVANFINQHDLSKLAVREGSKYL
ncbi:DNA alkylation repair protein [Lactiplantibacillus sp. WILCCON 0030]|uniref:DNA alkylation repair protein n=1 Tax=Lactiplantibacillus brownii TaxID=3069269 RepID=A0ABU1A999_9LACO|nr:DNA alkylation repair protein [Lactiplantibacillus brownii]MDQ7937534.1 DNA alkylation repair protein [Lactiplantibacillus brownii]